MQAPYYHHVGHQTAVAATIEQYGDVIVELGPRMFHNDTKFTAVFVSAADQTQVLYRTPVRDTLVEVKLDSDCFTRKCKCHKQVQPNGCLRDQNHLTVQYVDYVENDRGARSWLTSATVRDLLPKDDDFDDVVNALVEARQPSN